MDTRAAQRLRRAQRRLQILKRSVRWWAKATRAQRIAVLAEVRDSWPNDTLLGAMECNWYESAGDYLEIHGWQAEGWRFRHRCSA